MSETYFQDLTFERGSALVKGEYDNCKFQNGDFAEGNLSGFRFLDCTFNGCNLSLAKMEQTVFLNAKFKACKMLGLRFDSCSAFGLSFSFEGCVLNHASFYKTQIPKTVFKDSQLQEVDFAEVNLTSACFENCDLENAVFDQSVIEKVDFRTAINFSIDPEINRLKKAKFSVSGLSGLLGKYGIEIGA